MNPFSATALASIAAMLSIAAAISAFAAIRTRRPSAPGMPDLGELERSIEDLVRRLEATAGRCIHDLESREKELRRLLSVADCDDAGASNATAANAPLAAPRARVAGEHNTPACFATDLVSRAAQAYALAEQAADEATICRLTGFQRAELRTLLWLRAAQRQAA